ncbi:PREDICTED: uncharacterized protein LOC109179605 [Ipomoea nil]|uniref:uncharacterized protein LOC109179605 n=1 Tax=Ipomoea nil TaxID=35883 RepID=UPI0009018B49|nr:PREDICTED: uncharacterized protein LOC109179605 [Ipomoea nil]
MSTNSSERTETTTASAAHTTTITLTSAHHFVSMKLTNRNFLFWRAQLLPFLRGQGLLGYIDGTLPCPPATITVTQQTGESGATTSGPSVVTNLEYERWLQQDASILLLLISSLADEVMPHALGRNTAREVWESLTAALASSLKARCLNLLGQIQTLRQGSSTPAEYLGKARVIVDALSLAGRALSLDEQTLYVLRGLRLEFRAMASALTITGTPVSLSQLSDLLQAQDFIQADEFSASDHHAAVGAPTTFYAERGSSNSERSGYGGCQSTNNGNQSKPQSETQDFSTTPLLVILQGRITS